MGLLLPSTTPQPPKNLVPHPEPKPMPGDLTPENGLYSLNSLPVQPETVAISKPESQMESPKDIDMCKSIFVKSFLRYDHN